MDQATKGKYKFICFTDKGKKLMEKMVPGDGITDPFSSVESLGEWTKENFQSGNILVFIGACGIAVRAIAPFVSDKTTDPAVVVIDEKGEFVIPILSGHLGGGVAAAKELSALIDAMPVITTATDVRGEFAVDVFAKDNDLLINDMKKAKEFTAGLLENNKASYQVDPEFADVIKIDIKKENIGEYVGECESSFYISPKVPDGHILQLIPRDIVLGVGCRKDKSGEELKEFAARVLEELSIDKRAVTAITSIDVKKDEEGIKELAKEYGAEFVTFSDDVLMAQKGDFSSSEFVKEQVGADNVCERSLAAFGCSRILMKKRAENGMTLAVGVVGRSLRDE